MTWERKREREKEKEWEWTIKWRERNINVRCNKTNDAQSKKFILKQRNGNKEKSDIKRGCRGKQIYKIWDFFYDIYLDGETKIWRRQTERETKTEKDKRTYTERIGRDTKIERKERKRDFVLCKRGRKILWYASGGKIFCDLLDG